MRVTLEEIAPDLDQQISLMKSSGLKFNGVLHIGATTEPLGAYFADSFSAPLLQLPSLKRRGPIPARVIQILNRAYRYLPVFLLERLSEGYKTLYRHSQRSIPDLIPVDKITLLESGPLLLVDDNALTGSTFELWKKEIRRINSFEVSTFSITATGDYRPDYFCYDSWRSFSWRPIGI
ncbi:MAG: hypothetical protein ACP5NS_00055 [Candidatus Pacearchaeota archaeon]